jgi:esterase
MPLSTTRVGADNATRHLVMLHGIYGRGRNWQTIAKGLVAARPEYACWLVDLPHHGESGAGSHGNTVAGLAADVDDWLTAESLSPTAVLGHSFGGKVALALAARRPTQPLQVWVIDSTPDTKPPSGSAFDMMRVIRAMPPDFSNREEAVEGLITGGYAPGVAQWMSTNLQREGDRFTWQLDFNVMDELLADFFTADLWAVVESPAPGHQFHFLKASESSALSPEAVHRIENLPRDRVTLHHRPGGHWIHAESPVEVVSLLSMHLPQ